MVGHLSVARVAEGLGVAWNTPANTAVLAEGRRVLIDDPARFDGVRILGVDDSTAATRLVRWLQCVAPHPPW